MKAIPTLPKRPIDSTTYYQYQLSSPPEPVTCYTVNLKVTSTSEWFIIPTAFFTKEVPEGATSTLNVINAMYDVWQELSKI